jgi:hypothetical protein
VGGEFNYVTSKLKNMNKDNRLTNRDISETYREHEFWIFRSDILSAFSYWVTSQNRNGTFISDKPTEAYSNYITPFFENLKVPQKLSYEKLSEMIDEKIFVTIPEILELNEMEPDFIDLGALARNVFYMVVREQITSGYFDKKAAVSAQ